MSMRAEQAVREHQGAERFSDGAKAVECGMLQNAREESNKGHQGAREGHSSGDARWKLSIDLIDVS